MTTDLPPLPAVPFARVEDAAGALVSLFGLKPGDPLFTADQLRAYAAKAVRVARQQALEDAAERCEESAQRWPGSIEKHYVAHECAAVIRALKDHP